MHPVIARIGPFTVKWYGLSYALALLVALVVMRAESRRKSLGLAWEDWIDFVLITFPLGLVGARLYYVAFHLGAVLADPRLLIGWDPARGGVAGLAIHGGLIGGALGVYLFKRIKGLPFWKLADVIVLALPLAQALGRWGNFMNGDAYGLPTELPWGIVFPSNSPAGARYPGRPLHPSMLYELVLNLVIFSLLWHLRRKDYGDGFLTALYFISYSLVRSLVSFSRADSLWVGPIRAAHLISIFLVAFFSYLIFKRGLYKSSA